MSNIPSNRELDESRIERARAEVRRFAAEMDKRMAERQKRDRWLLPLLAFCAVGGGLGAVSFIVRMVWG